MADRQVTSILKTSGGDILALCNQDENWARRSKKDAIYDIENGIHRYYIKIKNREIAVWIDTLLNGKYLVASEDGSDDNFLLTLSEEVVNHKRIYFQR
ncbi:DUF3892 domain-containing protein [Bacteroidota bacterium]